MQSCTSVECNRLGGGAGACAAGLRRAGGQQRAASRPCAAAHELWRLTKSEGDAGSSRKLTLGDSQPAKGQEECQPHVGRLQMSIL